MLAFTHKQESGWHYWGLGVVVSFFAFVSSTLSPELSQEFPLCAALTLTFFWGLLRSE